MRRPIDMRGRRAGGGGGGFSPRSFGVDLLVWLRDTLGVTLSTVGEWKDQSPTADAYSQTTQAKRPVASSGGCDFDPTQSWLGNGNTNTVTSGAFTIGVQYKLDAVPGGAFARTLFSFNHGSSKHIWCFLGSNAGYQPISFTALAPESPASNTMAGIADALDTSEHGLVVGYDGTGDATTDYVCALDGTEKTVVASGAGVANPTERNSIGARRTPTSSDTWFDGPIYTLVVYSSLLAAPARATLATLLASRTSTYNDFAALGTVVLCMLPGVGQSGDVTPWTSQDPTARALAQATLANQPYYDLDDSVGDLRTSMIFDGTADNVACADIAAFSGATQLTVGGWVRQNAGATAAICGQWGGGDNCWSLEARVDGKVRLYTASGAADATNYVESDAAMITAATWVHVLVALNGATAQMYLNGALVASTITGTLQTLRNSAATFKVGTDATTYFAGRIDDLVCATRAATAAQANSLAHYYARSG